MFARFTRHFRTFINKTTIIRTIKTSDTNVDVAKNIEKHLRDVQGANEADYFRKLQKAQLEMLQRKNESITEEKSEYRERSALCTECGCDCPTYSTR